MKFSCGIDSYRFLLPKSTFLKFMRKIELTSKLRLVTRNQQIKEYVDYKFKNDKTIFTKIRYVNFKKGNRSLTNSMIVIENSESLNNLCKKRKKPYGYYVNVVFAGLYQPSREVFKETYRVLSKFVRRFKTYEFDVAKDFKSDVKAGFKNKEWFQRRVRRFGTDCISCNTTLYANKCQERFFGLQKICFYDKFGKQTKYHKQHLDEEFKDWHRVELTFRLKKKFLDRIENDRIMDYVAIMDEITNNLTDGAFPFGVDIEVLQAQTAFLKDNRRALFFTKSA
ncbi:MAG: hypothetical protein ACTTJC_02000 [Campylobacter sp.]